MKQKIFTMWFVFLLSAIVSLLFSPLKAQDILTVQISTELYKDQQVNYCPGYDSLLLKAPPDYNTTFFMVEGSYDSIMTDQLYLDNNFSGEVIFVGISNDQSIYLDKKIIFTPVTTFQTEENISIGCADNPYTMDGSSTFVTLGNITYSWQPAEGLSDADTQNPSATIHDDAQYTAVITSDNGCVHTKALNISMESVPLPEICIIGLNDQSQNIIRYNKSTPGAIDSIFVYRETFVTDNYELIGGADFNAEDFFTDIESNPYIQSNKYKLTAKDECGHFSDFSDPHKTMHLAINQGINNVWNLIWEKYEGFIPSTYRIYRGTSPFDLELIGTSPASNNQFSDFSAPEGYVYYQIEIVKPGDCGIPVGKKSTEAEYVTSRSNIATNNANPYGINDRKVETNFNIYPNPVTDQLTVESIRPLPSGIKLTIMNLTGRKIMEKNIISEGEKIDISQLAAGIYILQLESGEGREYRKVIKGHQ